MGKIIWTILYALGAITSVVLAVIAEHNEEYTKAIYEMLWLFLFTFMLEKEMRDE